jgi:hypothetical protein
MILLHAGSKVNTAMYFVMPQSCAVEVQGAQGAQGAQGCKTVSTDYEKQRVMLVLCGWWP